MKLYITGMAGMLGSAIYATLKNKADLHGLDIYRSQNLNMPCNAISLLDYESVKKDIKEHNPDIVIHTAALVNVDVCEREPEKAFLLNSSATKNLVDICASNDIKMVYISTDAVFDGLDISLYREDDKVNPINVYGQTKLAGEQYVLTQENNLILRTNIFGTNIQNKQSFGEWVYRSLLEDKTLKMFKDVDFSPILTNELAELIFRACQNDLKGIYHACGTGCITKYEFGLRLKDIFGIQKGNIVGISCDEAGLYAKRAHHMGMSNQKLSDALGVKISSPEQSIIRFQKIVGERKQYENENG